MKGIYKKAYGVQAIRIMTTPAPGLYIGAKHVGP